MYRYPNEYYNYVNNNYNQPLFTEDSNPKALYDPYQGFIRGNIFEHLYNGYKVNPIDLKPANEQAKLLTTLDALEFSLIDINLYLDMYPEDRDMLELYNNYRQQLIMVRNDYEQKYGPITLESEANETYPYIWINSPWPWEGGK